MTDSSSSTPADGTQATPPPSLNGRRFSLVPAAPDHHSALYLMSIGDMTGFRWRYRGAVPSFGAFEQSLYAQNVFVQFVIVPNSDARRAAGLVTAYNASLQDGTAYVAVLSDRRFGAGRLEGIALFLRYVFRLWPLRKVYLETPEFNVVQFQSAVTVGLLKEEGRLKSDRYYDGRYWDFITYALYRDDAVAFAESHEGMLREAEQDEQASG